MRVVDHPLYSTWAHMTEDRHSLLAKLEGGHLNTTVYNPPQKCHRCGSEMHASCGTGDHDTAADLEVEELRAAVHRFADQRDQAVLFRDEARMALAQAKLDLEALRAERDAYLETLKSIAYDDRGDGPSDVTVAVQVLLKFSKAGGR